MAEGNDKMAGQPSIPPRVRRDSLTNAGEAFRQLFSGQPLIYGSGPDYIQNLEEFMHIFILLTKTDTKFKGVSMTLPHNTNKMKIINDGIYTYNNVAIIGMFRDPANLASGHAVPYVKMNDKWYVGDDEKGILILRKNGPPTWNTKYATTWNMIGMYYFYINQILPVFPTTELNKYGFHGKITFKQHVSSCWTDSIQTVLMHSNGFREQFLQLYNLVKSTPGIFVGSSATVILQQCISRLSVILSVSGIYAPNSPQHKLLLLLSLSFIRMMTWEPPFSQYSYVTDIQGASGKHILQANNSDGAEPGPDIHITERFGGKRAKWSKCKTRKRKN